MVFTIASALQERLIEITEDIVKSKRDEEERQARDAEEAERVNHFRDGNFWNY